MMEGVKSFFAAKEKSDGGKKDDMKRLEEDRVSALKTARAWHEIKSFDGKGLLPGIISDRLESARKKLVFCSEQDLTRLQTEAKLYIELLSCYENSEKHCDRLADEIATIQKKQRGTA